MKRLVPLFCVLFLIAVELPAQNSNKRGGLAIDYGAVEYYGELGNQFGDFSQWQGGYGVSLSRYLSPSFNISLDGHYNFLKVMGPDTLTYSMNGNMYTIMGMVEYKFANGATFKEDALIKPYVKVGGGRLLGETWGSSMNLNGDFYKKKLNSWAFFFGGGFRVRLSSNMDAYVEAGSLRVTALGMDGAMMDDYHDQFMRMNVGLNFAFGSLKDSDRDGVPDKKDQCPDTPEKVVVDEFGCPFDLDGDGVADYMDECPDEVGSVSTKGCPDSDEDGLADKYDNCPDEPGPKSNKGCPVQEKNNNVAGGTVSSPIPAGVNIIFLYPGATPGTYQQIPLTIQTQQATDTSKPSVSVNLDSDGDGISDNIDRCPGQAGKIENMGCPDSDGDGVIDLVDQCPGTPAGAKVLTTGCPADSDGDGITDDKDACPTQPGSIRNNGCPIEHLSPKWRRDIKTEPAYFVSGQSFITELSKERIDQMVATMKKNPKLNIWLFGHTDPRGSDDMNAKLSEGRLMEIVNYMIKQGIDKERIYTMAFGESFPASLGTSEEDMKQNRRVEFYFFEF
jgi:OmpA-OmpF porin, OOP family